MTGDHDITVAKLYQVRSGVGCGGRWSTRGLGELPADLLDQLLPCRSLTLWGRERMGLESDMACHKDEKKLRKDGDQTLQ